MTTPIELTEYETSLPVRLTTDEVDALRAAASNKVSFANTPGMPGRYDITASSWIGQVSTDTTTLLIKPKITISQAMFLVSYALDPIRWDHLVRPAYTEASHLVEAVVPAFVAHTEVALRRGVLQGYRSEEDSLLTVRGRIRFEDQIRIRFGIPIPVEVRFDEYTEDIELNRLLKAAVRRLHRLRLRNTKSAVALRRVEALLSDVSDVEYTVPIPQVTWNRLTDRYRPAIELARMILGGTTPELGQGKKRSSAFLVDMNEVFEQFVYVALREELGLSERAFPRNARGRRLILDAGNRVKLEPDLSWWETDRCVWVGDVKYKKVNVPGVKHPDIYQMLAYTTATDLLEGSIIYAKGEADPVRHSVRFTDKTIRIEALDLAVTPTEVLAQIAELAARIRSHRYGNSRKAA